MSATAPEVLTKQPGESLVYCFDFTAKLDKDSSGALAETLTGTPTVTSATSGLTIGDPEVNTVAIVRQKVDASLTPYNEEIPIGAAVQVRISGGTDGTMYHLECSCATTLSNTRELDGDLQVVDQ